MHLCGADDETSAGDDSVHVGEIVLDFLKILGIFIKPGSETVSGPNGPVSFTSHSYWKDEDGQWHATFENKCKMLAPGSSHIYIYI